MHRCLERLTWKVLMQWKLKLQYVVLQLVIVTTRVWVTIHKLNWLNRSFKQTEAEVAYHVWYPGEIMEKWPNQVCSLSRCLLLLLLLAWNMLGSKQKMFVTLNANFSWTQKQHYLVLNLLCHKDISESPSNIKQRNTSVPECGKKQNTTQR